MIDPDDPPEIQVVKQSKIIDALLRRAGRQHEVGQTAYSAFQSAVSLQAQVWAKTRDLERASNELAALRYDRERAQKNFADALSVMEGGFALFAEGGLQICNDQFRSLLPDLSSRIFTGLRIDAYFDAVADSPHVVTDDDRVRQTLASARNGPETTALMSFVLELVGDRWFQINLQRTSSNNVIILQTEITEIVRKNRSEKDQLIDMQAHYLQAAFDHMSLGICTFARSGTVMICNDRFRELLGLPFTLVQRGTRFEDILDFVKANGLAAEDDLRQVERWPQKLREDGRLRQRLFHARGQVLDLHVHLLPDRGFLVDIADVSLEYRATELLERRVEERTAELTEANQRLTQQYEAQARVEDELRLAKEAAEAAMSSKTRFLAAASHDLLQPVNAAKILISTLSDMSRETGMHGLVQRLDSSFASMETLLHAILDISRLESAGEGLAPTDLCLGPILDSVIADQAPVAASKGVQLDCVTSSDWVRSDHRYLMRSIRNLVVNAIQYTESGRVLVGCRHRAGKVVLEVWDTGIGISRRDQKRIFDEFARAENVPPGSGLGLGLSIVDRTCRHLGHGVGVRSKPGVGSVFWIEMDKVAARPQRESAESPRRGGRKRLSDADMDLIVLVVESDPDVLFATVHRLESWGASVLGTHSTEAALEMVDEIGTAPDIVLVDYQLDGEDTGIRTIDAVRERTGVHIPAIMITSRTGSPLDEAARTHDFTVLAKPVEPSRLRPLIDWKTRGVAALAALGKDQSMQ